MYAKNCVRNISSPMTKHFPYYVQYRVHCKNLEMPTMAIVSIIRILQWIIGPLPRIIGFRLIIFTKRTKRSIEGSRNDTSSVLLSAIHSKVSGVHRDV